MLKISFQFGRDSEIMEEIKKDPFNETYEMITFNRALKASSNLSIVPWENKDLSLQLYGTN